MAQYYLKYQFYKYYRDNYSNYNYTVPKKPQIYGNLLNYFIKPDIINKVKEINKYGFSINKINRTIKYLFIIA